MLKQEFEKLVNNKIGKQDFNKKHLKDVCKYMKKKEL